MGYVADGPRPVALKVAGLGKRYGANWAIRDIAFDLPAGSFTALVGPNGAGKSTLIECCAGLRQPSVGAVAWPGRLPGQTLAEHVGFVAEDYPLYSQLAATRLLTYASLLTKYWDHRLAVERLQSLNIPLDRPIADLSSGQRAQVALTIALAKRAAVLLLDEPVARLDPVARSDFYQAIARECEERGMTIIISTHVVGEVAPHATHLLIIDRGIVRLHGAVGALLAMHSVLMSDSQGLSDYPHSNVVGLLQERPVTILTHSSAAPAPPGWESRPATLLDLGIGYLRT